MITLFGHEGNVENKGLEAYTAAQTSNDLVGIHLRGYVNERPTCGQKCISNNLEYRTKHHTVNCWDLRPLSNSGTEDRPRREPNSKWYQTYTCVETGQPTDQLKSLR